MSFSRVLISRASFRLLVGILFSLSAAIGLIARDDVPTVLYQPTLKLIEGDQPLHASYVLSITSPTNVVAGANLTISPVISVNSAPAGISNAVALSFVSLSQPSVTFTGPGQTQNLTVTVDVPLGTAAGSYAWAITTPGWAAGTLDPSAFINAKVTIPQVPAPPSVSISAPTDGTVYNLPYSSLPLSVPLTFTATAPANSPVMSIDTEVNGTAVTLTSTGLGTSTVQATGTVSLSAAGVYTVQAAVTNNAGTSVDTAEITLNVQAPAPTVTIVQPTASNFIYAGSPLNIPFSFTAVSVDSGVTALSATLNGTPLSVTPSGLNTLTAAGSGTLTVNAAGTYTLAVTGTTSHGTTSATKTFSVAAGQTLPPPTVTISQPLDGAVFTRVAGSPATVIPFAFTATAGAGSTITAVSGVLNGNNVIVNVAGIDGALATGSGNFSISAPGTYTFVASATGAGQSGSKSISFTVNETPAPTPDCTINWLPPISLGKVQQGGSVLPIKFTIDCCCSRCGGDRDNDDCNPSHRNGRGKDSCANEHDTSVMIFIYEIKASGATTEPDIFTYSPNGKFSRRDDTYEIDGNHYHLDYGTDVGVHRYHIDVYRQKPNVGTPQLLGTKEFTTR